MKIPAALFSLPYNNPLIIQLLPSHYLIITRLLSDYCSATLSPNLAAAPKYPYMVSSSVRTAL